MTVSELITALSHYDPNVSVVNSAGDSYQSNDLALIGASLVFDRDKPVRDPNGLVLTRDLPGENTEDSSARDGEKDFLLRRVADSQKHLSTFGAWFLSLPPESTDARFAGLELISFLAILPISLARLGIRGKD